MAVDAPTSAREKAARAAQLFQEVREAATKPKDGAVFSGAEDQLENSRKVAEAQRLLAEAHAEVEEAGKSKTEAELEQLQREAAAFSGEPGEIIPSGGSLEDLVTGKSGGHSKDAAEFNPFKAGKTQLVKASAAAMGHPLIENIIPQQVRDAGRELARNYGREHASSVVQREIAALVEGTQANGGFLVVPQYLQDMFAEVRRQGNKLRALGWLNIHQTEETNQVLFPKASGSLTAGLVAELAVKPTADNSFAQVIVSLYTMAGIAGMSRQLAKSSNPAAAEMLARDLGMLLGNLEEQKVFSGSGSGEPRGIINTTGLTATTAVTAGTGSGAAGAIIQQDVIDNLIDTAARIATTYYGPPTGAVMRPSRLAWLQQAKDTNGNYVLNRVGTFRAPDMSQADPGDTYNVIGFPLAQSTNVPAALGGGTNQDCIIVADWAEAHWFQRWDQQLDSSDIASDGAGNSAFASNRVLFRLEEIAGFSAERYPAAFAVITGTGMVSRF